MNKIQKRMRHFPVSFLSSPWKSRAFGYKGRTVRQRCGIFSLRKFIFRPLFVHEFFFPGENEMKCHFNKIIKIYFEVMLGKILLFSFSISNL